MPTFFSDDTSIYITGNSANDLQSKINETVTKLTEWFQRNRLSINKEKTIAISFHHPQKIQLKCPSVQLYDMAINYIDHSKLLGVWLDKILKWSIHTQNLTNKLSKICFGLWVVRRVTGQETSHFLLCLFSIIVIIQTDFLGQLSKCKINLWTTEECYQSNDADPQNC
jgi:hypothetical protein